MQNEALQTPAVSFPPAQPITPSRGLLPMSDITSTIVNIQESDSIPATTSSIPGLLASPTAASKKRGRPLKKTG